MKNWIKPVLALALAISASLIIAYAPASAQTSTIEIHKRSEVSAFASDRKILRFLVLGSDRRKDNTVEGQRADAIHVVSLNMETLKGSVINIPRDSYVEIAPKRGKERINAALELGGIETQIKTIENLVGFEMDYWAMTDFDGLIGLVNDIGGVTVDVPVEMNDKGSGAFFKAGPNHLDGDKALALSRNRHLETGDFERTANQTLLLLAIFKKLKDESRGRPNIVSYMDILSRHIETNLKPAEMFQLMSKCFLADPANIVSYTMKGSTSTVGGASVVILSSNDTALEKIKKTGVPE